jgi:Fe-S cluster assembly protein SufB
LKKYPELVKKYFAKAIALADHKFSALHYAVWS